MTIAKRLVVGLLTGAVLLGAAGAAFADGWDNNWDHNNDWLKSRAWKYDEHQWHPDQHPYYMHAMTDLRIARDLLARPDQPRVEQGEVRAVEAINRALHEMKDAAISDGKDPFDRMPPDAQYRPEDRFHQALRLLDKARKDASHEEDDPWLRSLQARIVHHIGDAEHAVNDAINQALR